MLRLRSPGAAPCGESALKRVKKRSAFNRKRKGVPGGRFRRADVDIRVPACPIPVSLRILVAASGPIFMGIQGFSWLAK
jgi:hypothetical protein